MLVFAVGTSGDVQISVSWDAPSDVDLHVVEPSGEELYYGHSTSATGGQLDVDSNPDCAIDGRQIENIRWPGRAPARQLHSSRRLLEELRGGAHELPGDRAERLVGANLRGILYRRRATSAAQAAASRLGRLSTQHPTRGHRRTDRCSGRRLLYTVADQAASASLAAASITGLVISPEIHRPCVLTSQR